jgi:hypothetical protein
MPLDLPATTAAPSAPQTAPAPAPSRLPLRVLPETYLTDDANLFRCVSAEMTGDPDGTALLEDCRTLDTFVIPLAEFDNVGLRIVRV